MAGSAAARSPKLFSHSSDEKKENTVKISNQKQIKAPHLILAEWACRDDIAGKRVPIKENYSVPGQEEDFVTFPTSEAIQKIVSQYQNNPEKCFETLMEVLSGPITVFLKGIKLPEQGNLRYTMYGSTYGLAPLYQIRQNFSPDIRILLNTRQQEIQKKFCVALHQHPWFLNRGEMDVKEPGYYSLSFERLNQHPDDHICFTDVSFFYFNNLLAWTIGLDLRAFIYFGLDVNSIFSFGLSEVVPGVNRLTLLMFYTALGEANNLRVLIKSGVNVDAAFAPENITALMLAMILGHTECAQLLLEAGANPDLKNQEGLTAREWADQHHSKVREGIELELAELKKDALEMDYTQPSSPRDNPIREFHCIDAIEKLDRFAKAFPLPALMVAAKATVAEAPAAAAVAVAVIAENAETTATVPKETPRLA